MSSGAQVDMDWAGTDASSADAAGGGAAAGGANGAPGTSDAANNARYLTDEEILGIEPPSHKGGYGGVARAGEAEGRGDSGRRDGDASVSGDGAAGGMKGEGGAENPQAEARATEAGMPAWMLAVAADPKSGAEASGALGGASGVSRGVCFAGGGSSCGG